MENDMESCNTKVQVEEKGDVAILRFKGDVSSFSEAIILGEYRKLPPNETPRILLDFSSVDYINSSGIDIILSMLMEAGKMGQKVHCWGLSAHYKKVFSMLNLPKFAQIHDSEKEGIAALNS